jgi:lysyl-tRNA synthetase class 2
MNLTENWRPTATIEALKVRATLLRSIREFFNKRNVLEVESPLISSAGNTDPEIDSIRTDKGHYLRTSPEFALKRLLAAGSGDIFELGRVFRAGEAGRHHNPEFTMLEWYRVGFSYHQLMDEVADMVRQCGAGKFDHWPHERLSYQQLFQRHLNIDPFNADVDELVAVAKKHHIDDINLDQKQWLDLLISLVIQPALPEECLTFIYDFPADQAALANIRPGTPAIAERFELYLGQTELANGYQELTHAKEQKSRFEAENVKRRARGEPLYDMDNHLIAALDHGLPPCAGVALGVDRLLMNMCNADKLEDILAFSHFNA